MNQKIFFIGGAEPSPPSVAEISEILGVEQSRVKFIPKDSDPREFAKAHREMRDGKSSLDGVKLYVYSNVESVDKWRVLERINAEVSTGYDPVNPSWFENADGDTVRNWIETGSSEAPAADDLDDLDDLFTDDLGEADAAAGETIRREDSPRTQVSDYQDELRSKNVDDLSAPSSTAPRSIDNLIAGRNDPPPMPHDLEEEPAPSAQTPPRAHEAPVRDERPFIDSVPDTIKNQRSDIDRSTPPPPPAAARRQPSAPAPTPEPQQSWQETPAPREPEPQQESRFYTPEPEQPQSQAHHYDERHFPHQDEQQDDRYAPSAPTAPSYQQEERAPQQYRESEPTFEETLNPGFAQPQQSAPDLNDEILGRPDERYNQPPQQDRFAMYDAEPVRQPGYPQPTYNGSDAAPFMDRLAPDERNRQVSTTRGYDQVGYVAPRYRNERATKALTTYVTASRGGCGKTTVSYVMAQTLADSCYHHNKELGEDRKVWLIEVDYANPKLEDRFGSRGKNLGKVAEVFMRATSSRVRMSKEKIRQAIYDNTIMDDGLHVLVCPYDLVEDSTKASHMGYTIQKVTEFIQNELDDHIILDAGTLTSKNHNPLDSVLSGQVSDRAVVVSWPDNVVDTQRTALLIAKESGKPFSNIHVFLNKARDENEFYQVNNELSQFQVSGMMPRIPEIDGTWVSDVDNETARAMAIRIAQFLKRLGYNEVDKRIADYEPVTRRNRRFLDKILGR